MASGRTVPKAAMVLILFLVVADIIGVVVCTLIDVAPLRHKSSMLPYAIWLVLGIFTGLFAYNAAGAWASAPAAAGADWSSGPGARRTGGQIVAVSALVLVALGLLFWNLYWRRGVAGEYFVPDSAPHSILFFLAVFGAMVLARAALMPTPAGK